MTKLANRAIRTLSRLYGIEFELRSDERFVLDGGALTRKGSTILHGRVTLSNQRLRFKPLDKSMMLRLRHKWLQQFEFQLSLRDVESARQGQGRLVIMPWLKSLIISAKDGSEYRLYLRRTDLWVTKN